MIVMIYGYSLLYLLSGLMAYELNAFQMFGVAMVCYVFDKVIFKTFRRFATILTSVIITLGIVTYVLYRLEELEAVLMQVADFVKVYFLSVSVDTVSIGILHQLIMITFIGIILMGLLERFINVSNWSYIYLLAVSIGIVIGGFLSKTMGSQRDREAFLIMSAVMILYYVYNVYKKLSDKERSFTPMLSTVAVLVLLIVAGAGFMYSVDSRPLTTPVKKAAFQVSSDVATEVFEIDKMSYYQQDDFAIQESFSFQNIEVMRVKTEEVHYLKAETYEVYEDGTWTRYDDLAYLPNDGDGIHKSDMVDPVIYERFYKVDEVEVTIKNINTNVLFMNNYGASDTFFRDGVRIMFDPRRGIYYANDVLEKDYFYTFSAIVPAYGDPYFDRVAREYSNNTVPEEVFIYRQMPEGDYSYLEDLAVEITKDLQYNYDKALAIEAYLKANYVYSESPGEVPEGKDPILHFLKDTGEGFCQQFSSAFILMTRSIGIPTRYATGFYVDIFEPENYDDVMMEMELMGNDGLTRVYDSDSHTWAEAYFPEVGWIMFEPTPGRDYRNQVIESPDFEMNPLDLEEGIAGRSVFAVFEWRYVFAVFAVLALSLIGYGGYRYILLRIALRNSEPLKKMLSLHKIIRYYYNNEYTRKKPFETPMEYAVRMDAHFLDEKDEGLRSLTEAYESVVYGQSEVEYEDLKGLIDYKDKARRIARRRVNIFTYYRMRLYEYFNYAHLKKPSVNTTEA